MTLQTISNIQEERTQKATSESFKNVPQPPLLPWNRAVDLSALLQAFTMKGIDSISEAPFSPFCQWISQ